MPGLGIMQGLIYGLFYVNLSVCLLFRVQDLHLQGGAYRSRDNFDTSSDLGFSFIHMVFVSNTSRKSTSGP